MGRSGAVVVALFLRQSHRNGYLWMPVFCVTEVCHRGKVLKMSRKKRVVKVVDDSDGVIESKVAGALAACMELEYDIDGGLAISVCDSKVRVEYFTETE